MNSSFSPNSTTLPTTPLNDWLIWHEVGHNAAETPLTVPGATEVANNVLALYMQDRYLGKMNRVADDITVAPEYLEESNNQAWARGGAGDRLLMYAQLKEWAEKNFDIKKWYPDGTPLPEFYSEREGMKGWNLFQLMHRKARGDEVSNDKFGGKNYCAESNGNAADTLMLCASWVAQTDLSEFFKKWNPGANAYQLPGASEMSFEGGVLTTRSRHSICRNRNRDRKPLIRLPSIRCLPSKPVGRIRRSRRIRHEIRRTGLRQLIGPGGKPYGIHLQARIRQVTTNNL